MNVFGAASVILHVWRVFLSSGKERLLITLLRNPLTPLTLFPALRRNNHSDKRCQFIKSQALSGRKNIHIIYSRIRKILNHMFFRVTQAKKEDLLKNNSALMSCSITDTILSIYPPQPTMENQEIHEVTYSLKLELFSVPNRNLLITLCTGKCWHAKFQNERENRDTIWAKKRREHMSCFFGSVWVRCKFVPSDLDRGYSQDSNIKEERNYHENW